jgi:hypothetical protein
MMPRVLFLAIPAVKLYLPIMLLSVFDYTATQILVDGTPNGKLCEHTTFCPTDIVRHTMALLWTKNME